MASRLSDKVNAAATPALEPGERIEATLPIAMAGMSPWLASSFGAIGALVGAKTTKHYGLVVTDRRLLVLRQGGMLKAAYSLESAYPRSGVGVAAYAPGTFYGKLALDFAGAGTLKLNFQRYVRKDAEGVATALRTRPA